MDAGQSFRPPDGYRFSRNAAVAPVPNSHLWQTTKPIWFELGCKNSGAWVCVPEGFETDGPTIPGIARLIIDPADARLMRAAVIHDYLLTLPDFSPTVSTLAFRDALVAGGFSGFRRTLMVSAVWFYTVLLRPRLRRP